MKEGKRKRMEEGPSLQIQGSEYSCKQYPFQMVIKLPFEKKFICTNYNLYEMTNSLKDNLLKFTQEEIDNLQSLYQRNRINN